MTGRAALALTLALTGCMADVGEGEDLTNTDFVTPIAPQIAANGMRQEEILGNGIVANVEALKELIENPLRDETFDPSSGPPNLGSLQTTAENQVFVRHLVECALDGDTYVKFGTFRYQGALGLAPKWNTDKPTNDELQLVSGCMLAFINIHAASVLLSIRAQNIFDEPLRIDGPVRAYAYQRDQVATPLPSFFTDCGPAEVGPNRNCGWPEKDAFVGTCDVGTMVDVGAGAKVANCFNPLGAGAGNPVMRACAGPRGCDFGSPEHIASSDNVCGLNPAVKFACPSSEEYSIMTASFSQLVPYKAKPKAKGTNVAFPARVDDIYKDREGAFYGDVFDPEALNPNIVVLPSQGDRKPLLRVGKGNGDHTGLGDDFIFLFERAFACHDPGWTEGEAYMTHRNCAIMDVLDDGGTMVQANICVARQLGECSKQGVVGDDPSARCQIDDSHVLLGDADYDDCADDRGDVLKYPVTTFLDEPCDLIGGDQRDPRDPNGKPTDGKNPLCERK